MILVTGATGNVGAEVVAALLQSGSQVGALTRDPAKARLPEGVQPVTGDLNQPEQLGPAFAGVEAVFLLAGYPDAPGLLARMHQAGVRRVVLLSSGAVPGGDLDNAVVRFNVVAEAAVRDSELEWTVLRPSGFMSNALRWLPQLQTGDVVREPFADVPIAVIDPADLGAVAALALTADGHAGHSYRLTGPQALLPAEQLRLLAAELGRDLRLEPLTDDQAREQLSAGMPEPMVDAFFQFFRRGGYDDSGVTGTVEHLLGRPARSYPEWARAHAAAFG